MNDLICFLDFETTGLILSTLEIIEFGSIITDINNNEIERSNFLIQPISPISKQIEELTGITNDVLLKDGINKTVAFDIIKKQIEKSKYLVAHNGIKFDFQILQNIIGCNLENKILLDTIAHIPLICNKDSNILKYKCFDYNIMVNQDSLHRAINDVEYMVKLFFKYGFNNILNNQSKKKITIYANTSFAEKDKAKALNFQWNAEKKVWFIIINEDEKEELMKLIDFPIYE